MMGSQRADAECAHDGAKVGDEQTEHNEGYGESGGDGQVERRRYEHVVIQRLRLAQGKRFRRSGHVPRETAV